MTKVQPPPKSWKHIKVELVIDGKVVMQSIVSNTTCIRRVNEYLYEARTQRLPWEVYISRSETDGRNWDKIKGNEQEKRMQKLQK